MTFSQHPRNIFEEIRQLFSQDDHPTVSSSQYRDIKAYLNTSCSLAEDEVYHEALSQSVLNQRFSKALWSSVKKAKVKCTIPNAVRLAQELADQTEARILGKRNDLERLRCSVDNLPDEVRPRFLQYIDQIRNSRIDKKRIAIQKDIATRPEDISFPTNPGRFVHNLSSLPLSSTAIEVLSLGPKFCIPASICPPTDKPTHGLIERATRKI